MKLAFHLVTAGVLAGAVVAGLPAAAAQENEPPACCQQQASDPAAGDKPASGSPMCPMMQGGQMGPEKMKEMMPQMMKMMRQMGMTPQIMERMQVLVRTPIFLDAPCPIFAQAEKLGLSEEQKKKLGEIENEARQKARAVLTPEQLAKLGDVPDKPVTMMETCPMMKMMMGSSPAPQGSQAQSGCAQPATPTDVEPQGAQRTGITKDFEHSSPLVGEKAPDFTLVTTEGKTISLTALLQRGPVVLEFGNYTCPTARNNGPAIADLQKKYGTRAQFIAVYAQESNAGEGMFEDIKQPTTQKERDALAKRYAAEFRPTIPVLVDGMNNRTWNAYGSPLNATFIIKRDGTVFYKEPWAPLAKIDEQLARMLR